MKIKLCEKNAEKIEAALKAVNGNATAHTFTRASEISGAPGERILERLNIPKKDRAGALLKIVSGDKVPNSYDYSRTATCVTLERGSAAWFLVHVEPSLIWTGGGRARLFLTAEQDLIAVKKLRENYSSI